MYLKRAVHRAYRLAFIPNRYSPREDEFNHVEFRVVAESIPAEHVVVRSHAVTKGLIEIVIRAVMLGFQHVEVDSVLRIKMPRLIGYS
jgi:hypothetical protein